MPYVIIITYCYYITLHYITLHYIILHYITFITLHYITLHYITLRQLRQLLNEPSALILSYQQKLLTVLPNLTC